MAIRITFDLTLASLKIGNTHLQADTREIQQGTVRVFHFVSHNSFLSKSSLPIQFSWSWRGSENLNLALHTLFGLKKSFGRHCYLHKFWLNIGFPQNREYTSAPDTHENLAKVSSPVSFSVFHTTRFFQNAILKATRCRNALWRKQRAWNRNTNQWYFIFDRRRTDSTLFKHNYKISPGLPSTVTMATSWQLNKKNL